LSSGCSRRLACEIRKIAAQQRVVEDRIARAHDLARIDIHDGGHRFLRRVGKRERARRGNRERRRRRLLHQHDVAGFARHARQQVRSQRCDDEERREAQRAGLREQEPELAKHGGKAESRRDGWPIIDGGMG
jgi:hypothetical protein